MHERLRKNSDILFDGDKKEESPLTHIFIPRNVQKVPHNGKSLDRK